jgi:hypothetical protein
MIAQVVAAVIIFLCFVWLVLGICIAVEWGGKPK